MTRVKICGITTPEDALLAVDCGASAIGLVFWPSSPRCVPVAAAKAIVAALPPFVGSVGVFVNQMTEARELAAEVGLAAVQLHGDEDPAQYAGPGRVIKAIPVRDQSSIAAAARVPAHVTVLLDAHDPVRRGGTGRPIDWTIAAAIARSRRVILSGGLTPENVGAAIAAVRPYAIDLSSGVESAPGRKDAGRLRALATALAHAASTDSGAMVNVETERKE